MPVEFAQGPGGHVQQIKVDDETRLIGHILEMETAPN